MSHTDGTLRELEHFINHIRVAVAIAIIQMQITLQKRGQNFSVSELCAVLQEKRVNWKSRCIDLEKQVQCLQTQISTNKDLKDPEKDKCQDKSSQRSFADTKFADAFFALRTLQFNKDETTPREDVVEYFTIGLKCLEDAQKNSLWPDTLLKTCSEILGKAYSFVVDLNVDYVEERFKQFVSRLLHEITRLNKINQHSETNRITILLTNLITGCNLELMESTLVYLFQHTEDRLTSFTTHHNASDFELIYPLVDVAKTIMTHALIDENTHKIYPLFIKLFSRIQKVYELSLDWPIINYRIWQLTEIIQNVILR